MSWNDWMNAIFGNAAPPPRPVPIPTVTPKVVDATAPLVNSSPVPGCDPATWTAYEALLVLREGEKYVVYYDSLGKPTGGIGHLLLPSDGLTVGQSIPPTTVQRWFAHDGASAMDRAVTLAKGAGITSQAFLPYLASVCYQLGLNWTKTFPNIWANIVRGYYQTAANAIDGTLWYHQTPVRAADFEQALRALPPKTT